MESAGNVVTKKCVKCGNVRPITSFYEFKGKAYSYCKTCHGNIDKNKKILSYVNKFPDLDGEVWVNVVDYGAHYQVSNKQRVRNRLKRIISKKLDKKGYYRMILYRDGKMQNKRLHRLIAEAFIPNPLSLPFINHKDGNKKNNDISNLEWCDAKFNAQHAYNMGLVTNTFKKGKDHIGRKITKDIYDLILLRVNKKETVVSIAKDLYLSVKTVSKIKNNLYKNKSWE